MFRVSERMRSCIKKSRLFEAGSGKHLREKVLRFENGDQAVRFVETHLAVVESEEGVITPHADVFTGVETSSALAQDDITGNDGFAAKLFDAETLAVAIASVLRSTLSFFM